MYPSSVAVANMPEAVLKSRALEKKLKCNTLVIVVVACVYNLSICQENQKEFEPAWEER